MISNVTGEFKKFSAELETQDEDFTTAKTSFTADIASINTGNEQRDAHLEGPDFFDSAKYPQLKFVSASIKKIDEETYELHGDLTIRDVTKQVKFDVEFGGIIKDPWGNTRAGFALSGKVNRKEFGLQWNAVTESGGVVVGDDVRMNASVEFIKS
jgi:polyisoprenoid-binding protein YceI